MADENKNINNEELDDENVDQNGSGQSGDDNSGDDNKGSKGDAGAKGTGSNGSDGSKTFTQDQVTRMMTREKNQGRAAAFRELGIDPKDEKTVKMFKAFVESQKTDEQKEQEEKSAQQTALVEAQQKALVAEAKAEAMMLGVGKQYVDDVVTLALSKMTDDSDLKTIIGEFKTKYPVWFAGSDDDDNKDGKKDDKSKKAGMKGTGSSVKTSKEDKKGDEKGLGARLAAQRKASSGKKSYWGK